MGRVSVAEAEYKCYLPDYHQFLQHNPESQYPIVEEKRSSLVRTCLGLVVGGFQMEQELKTLTV